MSQINIVIEKQGFAKDPHPMGEIKPQKNNYVIRDKDTGKEFFNNEVFESDLKKWNDIDLGLNRYEIFEDQFKSGIIFTNISVLRFVILDKRKATFIGDPKDKKIRILFEEWK